MKRYKKNTHCTCPEVKMAMCKQIHIKKSIQKRARNNKYYESIIFKFN